MSDVIVIGGSVGGLATAALLADAGHHVTVLERQDDPTDTTVGGVRRRPTVPQYAHSHAFASLSGEMLRSRLPDVAAALTEAGCGEVKLTDYVPPTLSGFTPEHGDEALRMTLARRSTFEQVLRERVTSRPGVTHVTGVRIVALRTAAGDPQRVIGVTAVDGRGWGAALVVDATGRRTDAQDWLADADLPVLTTESSSSRIVYYTRHYHQVSGRPGGPLNRGFGAGGLWNHYTAVLFRGDNGTFTISIGVLPGDDSLRALKDNAGFTAAVAATPLLAGWLDPEVSEPTSDVQVMGGLDNTITVPSPATTPATGFVAVGDAVCTTNPSYGRGVSLALAGACVLTDTLGEFGAVDAEFSSAFWSRLESLIRPWYAESVTNDFGRGMLWEGTLAGRAPGRPPEGVVTFGAAVAASTRDAEIWRRVARTMMMLAEPSTLYADPEAGRRIGQALAGGPPPELPGATRDQLVAAVAATTAGSETVLARSA